MPARSPRGASAATGFVAFSTGTGSPVRMASLDAQAGYLQQAQVCWNPLTRLQQHGHSPGTTSATRSALIPFFAVYAQHRGTGCEHLADGVHRLLGPTFLNEPNNRVGDDDG